MHGEDSWQLPKPSLSTFFRQSDGTSAIVGDRQVATFAALAELAGRRQSSPTKSTSTNVDGKKSKPRSASKPDKPKASPAVTPASADRSKVSLLSQEIGISVKVEVILPADASKETYEHIFRSIRQNLIDR